MNIALLALVLVVIRFLKILEGFVNMEPIVINRVPMPTGKSWKVLQFFIKNSRTWKVLENHFGPGKSWKLKLKVLESLGKISLKITCH